jgi:hypothetical protein
LLLVPADTVGGGSTVCEGDGMHREPSDLWRVTPEQAAGVLLTSESPGLPWLAGDGGA